MIAPRPWRRDSLALLILGLAVCGLASRFVSQPGYTDAYYYFGGARQLASGQGFTEPYVWNYLGAPRAADPVTPLWPSHLYWMPLVSLVAAPWLAVAQLLARSSLTNPALFRAAQLPFILLAATLPVLTYSAAGLLGAARRPAIVAALLTLFSPFYFVFWTTTDAFALYALAAAAALVCTVQAESRPARRAGWLMAAGLAAGLAHLTRADGVLLLLCLVVWVAARPAARPAAGRGWRARLAGVVCLLAGYAVIMTPWFWRDWAATGSPLGLGGLRTAWLTNYDDLFTFMPERLTLPAYLASGLPAILSGKWMALLANAQTVVAVQCGIVAFPFVIVGAWRLRRHPLLQLALFYGLALLAAMTLVFTFPGARGGYFHSGAALLPFLMPVAAMGLEAAVDAVARRLPHWEPEKSKPVFSGLLVAFAVCLTAAVFAQRVIGLNGAPSAWAASERVYGDAGAWLAAQGQPVDVAAVNDPPGWYYWTSRPAIVIPNGDAATLRAAMQTYHARYVLLDANRPAALSGLYADPNSVDVFILRARFADNGGQPAYLLELVPEP